MPSVACSSIEPTSVQDIGGSGGWVRGLERVPSLVHLRPSLVPDHDLADPDHLPLEPVAQDRRALVQPYEPGAPGDPRHHERAEPRDDLDLVPVHPERDVRHQPEPEDPPGLRAALAPLLAGLAG